MSEAKKDVKKVVEDVKDESIDISVLFNEDTSDETKERIKTVFEAAVAAKAAELAEEEKAARDEIVAKMVAEAVEELEEAVDEYLGYVVEKWLEENELAIESSFKVEMAESLMDGLTQLFAEHNMDIPEDADDVLEGLVARNEELQERLNEAHHENMSLQAILEENAINDAVDSLSEDLTDTQAAKLRNLAEGIRYTDAADFAKKLVAIKESFFKETQQADDPIQDRTVTEDAGAPKPEVKKTGDTFADRINSMF